MSIGAVDRFLYDIGMHPDITIPGDLAGGLLQEMEAGLCGRPSSLHMIPTYIDAGAAHPDNADIIVLDAGGTNLRRALVSFRDGVPAISELVVVPMPGSLKPITRDEFLTQTAELIAPLAGKSRRVGFCFSYVTEIQPNRDGRLVAFCKEVEVADSAGMLVGEALVGKLAEMGLGGDFSFTILNDTAACLMGGLANHGAAAWDGASGLILGTGTNTCYCERGCNIKKLQNAPDMIINLESGCFDKAKRGEADLLFDAGTALPGDHAFEKMFSGAYHGGVITQTAKMAAEAGLFSGGFRPGLEKAAEFGMAEIDAFLISPRGDGRLASLCKTDEDAETLACITDRSFERAGKLVCSNIAALMIKSGGGKAAPFLVTADGSAFQKSLLFRGKLDCCVEKYIEGELGLRAVFKEAQSGNLLGAALAAAQG